MLKCLTKNFKRKTLMHRKSINFNFVPTFFAYNVNLQLLYILPNNCL
uniref:Uncharacterized protein n=1 Tax=Anguilla anguilla TaxID=7936 RepID=A0A0E9UD64_ANGAN